MKKWYQSKIVWAGVITVLIGALQALQVFMEVQDYSVEGIATFVMGVLVIVFRAFFTSKGIES